MFSQGTRPTFLLEKNPLQNMSRTYKIDLTHLSSKWKKLYQSCCSPIPDHWIITTVKTAPYSLNHTIIRHIVTKWLSPIPHPARKAARSISINDYIPTIQRTGLIHQFDIY